MLLKGYRYIVTFIDDFSRYVWAYSIQDETQVHIAFQSMIDNTRSLLGKEVTVYELIMDNDTEYMIEGVKRVVKEMKILCQTAPPYTSLMVQRNVLIRIYKKRYVVYYLTVVSQKKGRAYTRNSMLMIYNNTPKRSIFCEIRFKRLTKVKSTLKYVRSLGVYVMH